MLVSFAYAEGASEVQVRVDEGSCSIFDGVAKQIGMDFSWSDVCFSNRPYKALIAKMSRICDVNPQIVYALESIRVHVPDTIRKESSPSTCPRDFFRPREKRKRDVDELGDALVGLNLVRTRPRLTIQLPDEE